MDKKDQNQIDLETRDRVEELNRCLDESAEKINSLMKRVQGAKGHDKVESLKVHIGVMEKNHEDLKKRFNEFMGLFTEPNSHCSLQDLLVMGVGFEYFKKVIEGFKQEENGIHERLNQIGMEFRKISNCSNIHDEEHDDIMICRGRDEEEEVSVVMKKRFDETKTINNYFKYPAEDDRKMGVGQSSGSSDEFKSCASTEGDSEEKLVTGSSDHNGGSEMENLAETSRDMKERFKKDQHDGQKEKNLIE